MLCKVSSIAKYIIIPVDEIKKPEYSEYYLCGSPFFAYINKQLDVYQLLVKFSEPCQPKNINNADLPFKFTVREAQYLELLEQEHSLKEISELTQRSTSTVDSDLSQLRRKFDCRMSIGVVVKAYRYGMMELGKVKQEAITNA